MVAFRERKIFLNIKASYAIQLSSKIPQTKREVISINITNCGSRPVLITSFGWHTGYFKKKKIKQFHDWTDLYSSKLPITLQDGESADYFIPKETFLKNISMLFPNYWSKFPWFSVNSLKIWVSAPLSRKPLIGKVDSNLKKLIFEELKKEIRNA